MSAEKNKNNRSKSAVNPIDSNIRKQMNEIITSNPKFHYLEPNYARSNPFFISWSRKPEFMGLCLKINESSKSFLRVEVTL